MKKHGKIFGYLVSNEKYQTFNQRNLEKMEENFWKNSIE